MRLTENEVIGLTEFRYRNAPVAIRLFAPVRAEPHSEYSCAFELSGKTLNHRSAARGFDSMQAIILALKMIGSYLESGDDVDRKEIEWRNGRLEFPQFTNRL